MSDKQTCPHMSDVMCSCKELHSSGQEEMKIHFLRNLSDMKLELSYNTLAAPAPYCLCVAGTCRTCGGRLCMSVGMPAHLWGEGFLAVLLYHAANLELKSPDQFVELFHEEDRSAVRRWLEALKEPEGKRVLPEPETPAKIYTIVQTAADADRGLFPDPFARGSYLSIDRARKRLGELIAKEKENLSRRFDAENLSEDSWEAYESDYAAAHFLRIEILSSDLSSELEGGPCNA